MVRNASTNIPEPFVEVSEAHLDQLLNVADPRESDLKCAGRRGWC